MNLSDPLRPWNSLAYQANNMFQWLLLKMRVCHKFIQLFFWRIIRWVPYFLGLEKTVDRNSPSLCEDFKRTPSWTNFSISALIVSVSLLLSWCWCYCFCSTFSCRSQNGVSGFCQRCPRLLGCGRWVWPFFEKWDSLALVLLCSFCPTLLVALMSCICFGRSFPNNKSVKPTCSAQICWY